MRTFLRAHWKSIVAIVVLVLLAMVTVNPGSATPQPPLAQRLRAHVTALAPAVPDPAAAVRLARAGAYIDGVLRLAGYTVHDGAGGAAARSIEAVLSNVEAGVPAPGDPAAGDPAAGDPAAGVPAPGAPAAGAQAARTFIVGARVDGGQEAAGGAAAVLELARLLAHVQPSRGTEIRFVFFLAPQAVPAVEAAQASLDDVARLLADGSDERPASFIAYVGSLASSRQVQDALSAFQSIANLPAHGLATPAYMQGVTLSDRAAWQRSDGALPALVLTDTSFTRFPYRQADAGADDASEQAVFAGMARVVSGLARTLTALAAGRRG